MFTNWLQYGLVFSDKFRGIYILLYSIPILVYHIYYKFKTAKIDKWVQKMEPVIYGFMLFMILANGGTSDAFIYFQF